MLVCHCAAVNDRRVRAAIESGARDEFEVALACGAGAECGGCVPTVQRLLDECVGCALAPRAPATLVIDVMDGAAVA